MYCFIRHFVLVLITLALTSYCSPDAAQEPTYADLYQFGKRAYTDEQWYECVAFLKRALEDYKYYKDTLRLCRKTCDRQVPVNVFDLSTVAPEGTNSDRHEAGGHRSTSKVKELKFWEKITQHSLCLVRCRNDRFTIRKPTKLNRAVEDEFAQRKPYSYLQICYWKLEDMPHAVSAAYTFLSLNSNDVMMAKNLEYYSRQPGFSNQMLVDFEEPEFHQLYISGAKAYDEENWNEVINKYERSLELFFEAHADCRSDCQSASPNLGNGGRQWGLGSTEEGDGYISKTALDEFYLTVADHHATVLRCNQDCTSKLSTVRRRHLDDFLPSHYHYLQIAYFKSDKLRKACAATGSYLLFYPEDESMTFNMQFYKKSAKLTDEDFRPRPEALKFYQQQMQETRLLGFIDEKFSYQNDDFSSEHADDYKPIREDISLRPFLNIDLFGEPGSGSQTRHEAARRDDPGPTPPTEQQEKYRNPVNYVYETADEAAYPPGGAVPADDGMPMSNWRPAKDSLRGIQSMGISVPHKEFDLNGQFRFVAEGLLNEQECQQLLRLSKQFAEPGNGYDGRRSPHTRSEMISGLSSVAAAELAQNGTIDIEVAKMYFDKSEIARDVIESYFNLSHHLYFDYTHLVCREAKPDSEEYRTELSHPIHGDNCVLLDGRCVKTAPAFTWRDYSSIIYLNDDFEGGEFIFTDKDRNIQAEVRPKCGKMVAFVGNTLHGVKAVQRGVRCVLAQWMTLDPLHQEKDRLRAQQMLAELELMRFAEAIGS